MLIPPYIAYSVSSVLILTSCSVFTEYARGPKPAWQKQVATPASVGVVAETVSFPSRDDLTLRAWWIAAPAARGTFVLAHGQFGNRSHMLSRAAFLNRAGYDVLDLDLRAHGESGGTFMTPGWKEADDLGAALAWLRARQAPRPLIVLGHSYGAVAAIHLSARPAAPDAVIADAAFISSRELLRRVAALRDPGINRWQRVAFHAASWPPVMAMARVAFRRGSGIDVNPAVADAIASARRNELTPVLYLAGERDEIAPPENTRVMFEATPVRRKQFVVIPGGTHDTYSAATREAYEAAVLSFANSIQP